MLYSAKSVANFFLAKSFASGVEVSALRLQKLLYYAQAWHFAHTNAPLIGEALKAWEQGPVFPSLFHELSSFGMRPITRLAEDMKPDETGLMPTLTPMDARVQVFLNNVWRAYRRLTDHELSLRTLGPDSPWASARHANPSLVSCDISLADLADQVTGKPAQSTAKRTP